MTTTNDFNKVFDYKALRLIIGLIAFSLPFIASLLASNSLTSISASYYTESRDTFVGMLCIVGAFLWAYKGHCKSEATTSKAASLAALCVAFFPTACDVCESNISSHIHFVAAFVLFSILAFFCFFPFRQKIKDKSGKKGLRSRIYLVCGSMMVACMLSVAIATFALSEEIKNDYRITFWAEAIALSAFGFAWIIAGKYFSIFVDEEEALKLFRK